MKKYRIYDKAEKEYVEEPDHRWLLSREGKIYNSENDEWYTVGEQYVLEWFTGLPDKNRKEIYEGDIIQDNNGIGVLIWFQTSWGVASYAYGYDGLRSYTAVDSFYVNEAKEWEVIGNIHDNPELIK